MDRFNDGGASNEGELMGAFDWESLGRWIRKLAVETLAKDARRLVDKGAWATGRTPEPGEVSLN